MTPLFNALPPVQKRLLLLLQNSMWGNVVDLTVFEGITTPDWKELMELAAAQGAFALAYDGLSGLPDTVRPPKALLIQWAMGVRQIERRYEHQVKSLQSITKLYSDNGIKCLLIKGIGLSRLYPKPEHRESGDLDLFLFGDYVKGNRLAEEMGIAVDYHSYVHSHFIYEGTLVENHFSFLNTERDRWDRDLEKLLHQTLTKEALIFRDELGVNFPPLAFNLLFVHLHAIKHFIKSDFVLRQLCDWAFLLRQCSDAKEIEAFNEIIREFDLHRYADAFNTLASSLLGVPLNENFVCNRDLTLAQKVAEEMMRQTSAETAELTKNPVKAIIRKMKTASSMFDRRWRFYLINKNYFLRELLFGLRHNSLIFSKHKAAK